MIRSTGRAANGATQFKAHKEALPQLAQGLVAAALSCSAAKLGRQRLPWWTAAAAANHGGRSALEGGRESLYSKAVGSAYDGWLMKEGLLEGHEPERSAVQEVPVVPHTRGPTRRSKDSCNNNHKG